MNAICPNCKASVLKTDKFCPSCGTSLTLASWTEDDYRPLPGMTGQPDLRRKKRRRRRRPWYRRPLPVILTLLAVVLLAGSVGAVMFVQRQFDDINEVSTPPPVISGAVLDAEGAGEIDTSPAQRALELAEAGQTGEFPIENNGQTGPVATAEVATPAATPVATPLPPHAGDGTGGLDFFDLTGTPRAVPTVTPTVAPTQAPTQATTFKIKPVRDLGDGSRTVLLMSVDAPEGEPIDATVPPDQLAVLHFDGETGVCRVLEIPTGMRTSLPGYGESRISHALPLGGIRYEVLVVEQLLGVKMDHYGLIDWGSVDGLVDAVDGVTVDNPEAFEAEGFSFAEGEIELTGEEALVYSREQTSDEVEENSSDDVAETRRNQVLRGLIAETSGMDVVRSANRFLSAVRGHVKSDLDPREMIGLATDYRNDCTSETLETASIDGAFETLPDPIVERELVYTVVDQEEIDRRVEWLVEGDDPVGTPVATATPG